MKPSSFSPRDPVPRFVLALAAVVVSVGSFAVLLAGFDQASPQRWLVPTPTVMALVAECGTLPERAQRDDCSRRVVAVLIEHQRREVLLAQR